MHPFAYVVRENEEEKAKKKKKVCFAYNVNRIINYI